MTLAPEPRTSPIVPSYGESSLPDLSASVLASLTGDTAANVLGLPETSRVCLLIVDGLGLEQLRGHQAAAPFLAELAFNSRPLTAEVLLDRGRYAVVREHQTFEEMIAGERPADKWEST